MKKNHFYEARRREAEIIEKSVSNGLDLQISTIGGNRPVPHWIFRKGTLQIVHYWPTTGRVRFLDMEKSSGFATPMEACDMAIELSRDKTRVDAIRNAFSQKHDKTIDKRDASVSRPNSERLAESLSDPIEFGKHKGTPWKDVPDTYLRWVSENFGLASIRKMADLVLQEVYNHPSHNLTNTLDSAPVKSVESNPLAHRPMGEWERKYLLECVETFSSESEVCRRAKELLEEEAPF